MASRPSRPPPPVPPRHATPKAAATPFPASPVATAASSSESKGAEDAAYTPQSFSDIRKAWVVTEMKKRQKEYTEAKPVSVFLGTWNVNAKKVDKEQEPLGTWLVHDDYPTADILAIGFQEIVDLNAVNLVSDHTAAAPWEEEIEKTLQGKYMKVTNVHLVGLSLSMFVKKTLIHAVSGVATDTVGVGIMGVGGNKGGVAIRLQIYDSTLVIVNSHLAAHKGNVAGRNMDYKNVSERLSFGAGPNNGLFDHDYIFWIGDLNYRLTLSNETDMQTVFDKIKAKDWPFLLEHDQLLIEKGKGTTFQGWAEGPIDFPPTYKYTPMTDEYDQKKKRMPAWCDRIQWRPGDVQQKFYRACNLKCSDHKPVAALFDCAMKIIQEDERKKVHAEVLRQMDDWENNAIPKVELSSNNFSFGIVKYEQPLTQTLKIKNVGVGAVKFRFMPQPGETDFRRPWFNCTPVTGFIPPGGSADVHVTVHVTKKAGVWLNLDKEKMDSILILGLENGRDFFVMISGEYHKSCFATPVEKLVSMPLPVRPAPGATAAAASQGGPLSVPKELWRITDALYPRGLDEEGLFLTAGDSGQIDTIRECLDTGVPFPHDVDALSLAETLTRFLESLPEPIFPAKLAAEMPSEASLTAWCMQSLVKLPPAEYNTFIYLISFLREVLAPAHMVHNKVDVDQLVIIFGSCLMHWNPYAEAEASSDAGSAEASLKASKEWRVLHHFLTSPEFN